METTLILILATAGVALTAWIFWMYYVVVRECYQEDAEDKKRTQKASHEITAKTPGE